MHPSRLLLIAAALPLAVHAGTEASPLAACHAETATAAEVGECLDARRRDVEAELAEVVSRVRGLMRELAEETGKLDPIVAFDASQREFENFRAINCDWHYEMLAPGAGAGHAQTACRIGLTLDRVRELQMITHDAGRAR